ncbi:hypothetical protein BLOT_012638 [Blomia tropicalis]|nr:hypothetical protein BLOT_012638 [Blomia tropicalis]
MIQLNFNSSNFLGLLLFSNYQEFNENGNQKCLVTQWKTITEINVSLIDVDIVDKARFIVDRLETKNQNELNNI